MADQGPQFVLRNYTELKRVERRLHSIGDWVLPFAIPYRGLLAFVLIAIPTWVLLSLLGVQLQLEQLWIWLSPPGLGAAAVYALRIQGKSLPAVLDAHVQHAVWWLAHRNDSRSHEYVLMCLRWVPDHPAYPQPNRSSL